MEFGPAVTSLNSLKLQWYFYLFFSHCFLAHPAFPSEYMVNSEYMERDPPKVYPGCSGVYPYHPFPMGFAINQPSCRGAPSPPGISLQKGFRHIPSNYGPGNAASVSVSSVFFFLINSRSTAVVGLKDLWSSLPAEVKLFCSILLCSVLF